ncbi:MAG: type II toxin-antitoxin system RelE/ParE family toxin [Gammaproteobacteria bacterium]|nr:type II toxin-antitoxin system RelE/ParE family toxin [Gammaproteobacteria bacterium]
MIRIKATPKFLQLVQKAMTSEKLQELINRLALSPETGVLIAGTGGIRKLRWQTGKNNKGKSGGVRVLYYYDKNILVVLLITLYRKSDQENIDANEKMQLKKMLPELLRDYAYE